MLLIKLLRLLAGYVCFYAENGFPERFVNLCSMNSVPLWNLKRSGSKTSACTTINGYLNIKSCAVRSGMRLHITARRGLPFFAAKYRRRAGLLCGLAFFFAAIGVLSNMVWTIDISGNNRTTNDEIYAVLGEAGLHVGMMKSDLYAPQIRFYALTNLPDVTYITVNVIGSSVQVEVTERLEKPAVPADEAPCDVVSTVDGQVVVLEAYEGTKLHEPGDAVRAGEVLSGGFVELRDGSVRLRHAQAYAIMRTTLTVNSKLPDPKENFFIAEQYKKLTLHLFGFNINLPGEEPDLPCAVRRSSLKIGGVELPLGYTVRLYSNYKQKERTPDKSRLALDCAESYLSEKVRVLGGAAVCEESLITNGYAVTNEVLAEISAGAAREMLIEQTG